MSRRAVIGFVVTVAVAVVLVALVVLATGALQPSTSSGSPPPTQYVIQGTSISFSGNAANDFEVSPAYTCTTYECGQGTAGSLIWVPIGVAISNFNGNCNSPQYEVTQISASSTGAFVIYKVSVETNSSDITGLPGFAPTNYGGGACTWAVIMEVEVKVVPQGPTTQTLYLTVEVDTYP